MDKFVTNTLTHLLLISKIPREGKLTVKNGELNIYQGGFINWTIRTLSGDGKEATIIFLKEFYLNIRKIVLELIKQNNRERDAIAKGIMTENLVAIIVNLYTSREGITNLQGTYRDYIKITSNLEYIEEHVIVPTIKFYLKSDEPNLINLSEAPIIKKILEDPKIVGKKIRRDDKSQPIKRKSSPIQIPGAPSPRESPVRATCDGNPFNSRSLEEGAAEELENLQKLPRESL